jgi:hypothetical protein
MRRLIDPQDSDRSGHTRACEEFAMYSPQPPQQQPPYQQEPFQQPYQQQPYGQGPHGQPAYGQSPYGQVAKDPTVGLLLEFIGFFGFLGIGWIWSGETAIGIALLVGWLVFLGVEVLLSIILIGLCLIPLNFIIPIASGVILMSRLKAKQAAAMNLPTAY